MNGHLPVSGTAPYVIIRLDILVANAARWRGPDAVADLRADACGHGVAVAATAVAAAGIRRAVVDEIDREAAESAGLAVVDTAPTVDAEALFGLTGVGEPVMIFGGTVLGVKPLLAGEGVSYGYTHRARENTRVALVSGGYAQGVVRALGGRADVEIRGGRHPIVGRVAMDVCVVDIGDAPVVLGDDVVFFGAPEEGEPHIQTWVQASGMRATELVTAVGLRARREVIA